MRPARPGRGARTESGATALEFGIVAPLMFLLIFGLVQYGFLFWSLTTASATAREAARRMVVGNDWATCALPWAVRHAENPAVGVTAPLVTRRFTTVGGVPVVGTPAVGDLVEVTVAFQSLYLGVPFIPVPQGGWVSETVTARVQNVPATPVSCDGPGNL